MSNKYRARTKRLEKRLSTRDERRQLGRELQRVAEVAMAGEDLDREEFDDTSSRRRFGPRPQGME